MSKAPLSVIIAAFNEEARLADCLKSVEWADQVLVVDGQSTDRTRDVAQRHGAEVLVTDNSPAETQRLKGLGRARHGWFFLLDADERVSPALRAQIERTLSAAGTNPAYYVLRENLYKGRAVHLHSPDYQLRLFKKSEAASLPEKIHRIPKVSGEAGKLDGALEHLFFTGVKDYLDKLNRYTAIEASYRRGQKTGALKLLFGLTVKPAGRFIQYYFIKKGFLDGFFGFFYSVSSAYYEWAVTARVLLDDSGGTPVISSAKKEAP